MMNNNLPQFGYNFNEDNDGNLYLDFIDYIRLAYDASNRDPVWGNPVVDLAITLPENYILFWNDNDNPFNLNNNQRAGQAAIDIGLNYNVYPCQINNVNINADFNFQYGGFPRNFTNFIGVVIAESIRFGGLPELISDNDLWGTNLSLAEFMGSQIVGWRFARRVRDALMDVAPIGNNGFINIYQEIVGTANYDNGLNAPYSSIITNWRRFTTAIASETNRLRLIQNLNMAERLRLGDLRSLIEVPWIPNQ